jgi:hypothetical protein
MEFSQLSSADDPNAEGYVRGHYGAPRRSRYVAALLSAGICALLLLVLLSMAALDQSGKMGAQSVLTAMNLSQPPGEKSPSASKSKPAAKSATMPHQQQATAMPKLLPHVQINNPNKVEWPEGFVHMSHDQLAASDIGNIHSAPAAGSGDGEGSGGGGGGGGGQGGTSYFNVDWYRKPPKTVFENYMRPGQQTGRWAMIDCRMIENYHVEDCHEVGEEPRGTGMARVMREAAWQFLVRPPRKNGQTILGGRVRITYTFTQVESSEGEMRTGEAP